MIGTVETMLVDLAYSLATTQLARCQLMQRGHTIGIAIGGELIFASITAAHQFLNDGGTSRYLPSGWNVVDGWCVKQQRS